MNEGEASRKHKKPEENKKAEEINIDLVFERLARHEEWIDVLNDPLLRRHCWKKYNTIRKLWRDIQINKKQPICAKRRKIRCLISYMMLNFVYI